GAAAACKLANAGNVSVMLGRPLAMAYRNNHAHLLRLVVAMLVGLVGLIASAAPAHADTSTVTNPRLVKKGKDKGKVDSAPPRPTVYIDSKDFAPVGTTPWTKTTMPDGSFLLIVELEGYEPVQKQIKIVKSRKLQEIFIPLAKKIDPPRIDVRADA